MPLPRILENLVRAAVLITMLVGCQPDIGDSCSTGIDCSQTGDRTCDTTMPGGYCTKANCEPDSCPEEGACIAFALAPSTALECRTIGESRGVRAFCMRRCSSQEDCRSGYECLDLNRKNNPWGAERIDRSSGDGRVCALPYGAMAAVDAMKSDATKPGTAYCTASTREKDAYHSAGASAWVEDASAGSAGWAGASGFAGGGGGAAVNAGTTSSGAAGSSGAGG